VLAGFPPSIVDLQPSDKISLKIQNQETIRVEIEGANTQAKAKAQSKANTTPKVKPKPKSQGKRKMAASSSGNKIHTLFGSNDSKAKKPKKTNASSSSSGGSVMTLGGGGTRSGAGSPSRKRVKAVQLTSKDDAQNKLVAALSSSGARDTASQFLRAATKGAVLAQWEIAKANARFSAALAGDFAIEVLR
jgi:hypothetical protein